MPSRSRRRSRGDLVPDDVVLAVVGCVSSRRRRSRVELILDGFPHRAQAEARPRARVRSKWKRRPRSTSRSTTTSRARLAGRAAGGRVDDADAEVIEHRLQVFHDNMRPILDFYRERDSRDRRRSPTRAEW